MNITSISNPRYANQDGTLINVDVEFDAIQGVHGFTSKQNDLDPKSKLIYDQALAGTFGPVAPYTPDTTQAAREAQAAQDAQDKADAKADAQLKVLLDMSPAQIDAWMASNVTTIAQARVVLARLAKAVAVIARREFR